MILIGISLQFLWIPCNFSGFHAIPLDSLQFPCNSSGGRAFQKTWWIQILIWHEGFFFPPPTSELKIRLEHTYQQIKIIRII